MWFKTAITALYVAAYGYCTTLPGFEPQPPPSYADVLPGTHPATPDLNAWWADVRAEQAASIRASAIARVMAHEGDYANNRKDPGGPTRYGITRSTARRFGYTGRMDVMPKGVAVVIYEQLWAESRSGDVQTPELAFQRFDAYVNHGPRAIKWSSDTGDSAGACAALNALRLKAYKTSPRWTTFGRGWSNRVAENLSHCV